jgi:hypothetical protein
MPIFLGFIFFGLCMFWRSERFINTSTAMITLFAMSNGDSVIDIFYDLARVNFLFGQIYCYLFCIIFIIVFMNVFISIIEEAYVNTKMQNQDHWIYSYLSLDSKKIKHLDSKNNEQSSIVNLNNNPTDNNLMQSLNFRIIREETNKDISKRGKISIIENSEKAIEIEFTNVNILNI